MVNNHYICPVTNAINNMKWKELTINGRQTDYRISERGDVYSHKKNRLLKGGITGLPGYEYKSYYLEYEPGKYKWFAAHRLVYTMFVGPIKDGLELNHKDLDKSNNHYSNLEVVTRWDNICHARQLKHWDNGRKPGFKQTNETRNKMSMAKMKPISIYYDGQIVDTFISIEETAQALQKSRKTVQRHLKSGHPIYYRSRKSYIRHALS